MKKKGPGKGEACGTPVFNDKSDKCFRHTPKTDKPVKQQPRPPAQQPARPQQSATVSPSKPAVRRAGTRDDLARKLNAIANSAINEIVDEKKGEKEEKKVQKGPAPPPPMALAPPRPAGGYRSLATYDPRPQEYITEGDEKGEEDDVPEYMKLAPTRGEASMVPQGPRHFRRSPINKQKVGQFVFDKIYCGAVRKVETKAYEREWFDARGAAAKLSQDEDVKGAWNDLVEMYFPDFLPEQVHPGIALIMASAGCIAAATMENKVEKVFQIPGYSKKRKRYADEESDDEEIRRPPPRKRHRSLSISSEDEELV